MPVECPIRFQRLEREEFQQLDYRVMACAFASHRELGRNCDEQIYRNDLAGRLEAEGLGPSQIEVPVCVMHAGFMKEYRLDLVVAGKAIYEIKAARAIATEHEGQELNYLLLTDSTHGKVLNFRPASLESRFVNNSLTREDRHRFSLSQSGWQGPERLKTALLSIVEDLGLFLETALYNQILVHHYGGVEHAVERHPLSLNGRLLGSQPLQMCAPEAAFRVTALSSRIQAQQASLIKLLALTKLKSLHWINLNRHSVEFRSLIP